MKFIMNRDFVVKHLGHSIGFQKGVPVHVPPEVRAEARKFGAVPEDGQPEEIVEEKPEFFAPKDEPQNEERLELLMKACQAIVDKNDSKEFGANGAPKTTAFLDLCKFRIDAKERNEIWAKFNQKLHAESAPTNMNTDPTDLNTESNDS